MDKMQDAQSIDIRALQGGHDRHIEQLAASTKQTLDQISREFVARQSLEDELNALDGENQMLKDCLKESCEALGVEGGDCAAQLNQLKAVIDDLKKQNAELAKECGKSGVDAAASKMTVGAGASKADVSSKADILKAEESKVEATKIEAPKAEAPKAEAPKAEAPKAEAPKAEAPKAEAPKAEATKAEAPKAEAPKAEAPKAEAPKAEAPKAEAPKAEAPKAEAPKAEAPKAETPKAEAPKAAAAKTEDPKAEASKAAAKAEASKADAPKAEPPKSTAAKAEADKAETPKAAAAGAGSTEDGLRKALLECQNKVKAQEKQIQNLEQQAGAIAKDVGESKTQLQQIATLSGDDCKRLLEEERKKNAQLQKKLIAADAGSRGKQPAQDVGPADTIDEMKRSLTNLASKKNKDKSSRQFEREFRTILDQFVEEICQWHCDRRCKQMSALQEVCKKIVDYGIHCLTYKELVYLHQEIGEAAAKLKPKDVPSIPRDIKCCKCSGDLCHVPTLSKDRERILLGKLANLEEEIKSARDNLRQIRKGRRVSLTEDDDPFDLETLRPNGYNQVCVGTTQTSRPKSVRIRPCIQDVFEYPTKDKSDI